MVDKLKRVCKTEYYLTCESNSDILVAEKSILDSKQTHFSFPEMAKALPSILTGKAWYAKESYWIKFPEEIDLVIRGLEWIDAEDREAYKVSFIASFRFSELFQNDKKLALFLFSLFRIFSFSEIIVDKKNDEVWLSLSPPMPPLISHMTLQPQFWDMVETAKVTFLHSPFYFISHSKVFKMDISATEQQIKIKFIEKLIQPPPYRETNFVIWLLERLLGIKRKKKN